MRIRAYYLNTNCVDFAVARTIYPDQQCCVNPLCVSATKHLPLKKEQQRKVVIYTAAEGACLAWSVHLYCARKYLLVLQVEYSSRTQYLLHTDCRTNYHNNFSVCDDVCTYYPGVPGLLQVGEHQFVEKALVNLWVDLMLTAWQVVL